MMADDKKNPFEISFSFSDISRQMYEQMYYGRAYDLSAVVSDMERRYGRDVVAQITRNSGGDIQALRDQLASYSVAFEQLRKQACPYGVVVSVRKDCVVVDYGGKKIETAIPAGAAGKALSPGVTVKLVGDTLQILDVIEDNDPAGEVATVTRIASPKTCEIDRAGTTRAISYSGALEEGDRVVVDNSGSVVIANLGKPSNDCTFAESTGVTWDDIGGLVEAKRAMREAVEAPTRHAGLMARYGKKPIKGVLLYGGPGLGKTMLGKAAATALAGESGAPGGFFYVKGPELLNMYVGNSEANIRKLFTAARLYKKKHGHPAIIFLDEADAVLGKRSGSGFSLSSTIVPAFLAEMDGLQDSGALVLLATNRPDVLDPAVVRDGRIDRRIKVTRPSRDDARDILSKYLRGKPLAISEPEAAVALADALYDRSHVLYRVRKHSTVAEGVPLTLGHIVSGAMLAGIVDRVTSIAMHRELGGGESGVSVEDLRGAVLETFRQAQDVNHDDEIAEFCEGWEHEVTGIERGNGRKRQIVTIQAPVGGAAS